jgi:hypothetical protein
MIAALFLFSILWLGLLLDEELKLSRGDVLVRIAAAIALGAFCGAWLLFLISWMCGFTDLVILGSTVLILGVNILAWRYKKRNLAWLAALPRPNRTFWFASCAPTVLLTVYFGICVWSNAAGDIYFRGNTRDLAFHLGTISAFVEQSAFPPFNPQSAGAQLSYHFMANFFSAILCKGGFDLIYSVKIPMVLFAFSLSTLTCHFFYTVAKNRMATLFASLLFFFGHIGVINLLFGFAGYPASNLPLSVGSWGVIEDHITYPYYNFLNVIIDFFQPQLPFLAAFPLAVLVLVALYRNYTEKKPLDRTGYFILGIISFLPLYHMHTFLTLGPLVGLFVLFAYHPVAQPGQKLHKGPLARLLDCVFVEVTSEPSRPSDDPGFPLLLQKLLVLFLAAIPVALQLAFILSQKKTADFSGFDVAAHLGALPELPDGLHLKRVWFWVRVAGSTLVPGLLGLAWWVFFVKSGDEVQRRRKPALLAMFAVTGFYFLVINFYRFTPNWGDSNKFFLYLDLLLCLCGGQLLAQGWQRSRTWRVVALAVVGLGAVVPSGIEWAMRYRREPERLFSASDRVVADWIKINTPRDAVFLTANSFVHLVPALAGRRVVNGSYTRETGFADSSIEEKVARAYREADPLLIENTRVTHVMIGPEEIGLYRINRSAFNRYHRLIYDQPSMNVGYAIYEVRSPSVEIVRARKDQEDGQAYVWVSELEPRLAQQSYGSLKYDRAFNLDPLTLKGHRYANGLGTHASSDIQFNLGRNYKRFEADIGLDDSQMGGAGSVQFEVWADDQKLYQSKTLRAGDTPEKISVDISGKSILRLVVTDAGDGDHSDHADWADPRLLK